MESVKQIIMYRDNLSSEEADDLIGKFRDELQRILDTKQGTINEAEELVKDYFGLEPDYLVEFLIQILSSYK